MAYLPLANILHHKLRSVLSAMGIGIGICMLVTLSGLSRGSLNEIADRWESVDAELIAFPKGLGDNVTSFSGIGLPDKYRDLFFKEHGDLIQRISPVFLWSVKIGGQNNMATGIDAKDWDQVASGKILLEGHLPDAGGKAAAFLETRYLTGGDDGAAVDPPTDEEIRRHEGLEVVIDARLAKKGHYRVGDDVELAGHTWKIVGIAPSGVVTRVFMPRRVAQRYFGTGSLLKSTFQFIKLKPGVDANAAAAKLSRDGADIMLVSQYRQAIQRQWGMMYVYITAVNIIALIIAFLFIMITLYTMVLQRTREIAILKSCGASNAFVWRQVIAESLLLTLGGTLFGVGISFAAAWFIGVVAPLLTVQITWYWIAIGVGSAIAGALVSAIYPAWRATRVDMVEALTFE